jgi:para-aminobenzoate synthetase/4-amino-4-deoxychorismate lyase
MMKQPQTHDVIVQVGDRWHWFTRPVEVVIATRPEAVLPALRHIETAVNRDGVVAAGFLAYEAAAAFDLAVHPSTPDQVPLLWFGLYERAEIIPSLPAPPTTLPALCTWQPQLSAQKYHHAIAQIKEAIAGGYTYQANFTFPLQTTFSGSPWSLFLHLLPTQQACFASYVDTGRFVAASLSPELFFSLNGDELCSRPMKGTAARSPNPAEDRANREWLAQSEKNRAENVMILDMIRNDMGRVCRTGSVAVPRLFEIETYPTLFQMTSTVTGRTTAPFTDIMTAMFPCASITGAPKVRTMEILAELEQRPRQIYTGTIGFLAPGRRAQFNVAIRTLLFDRDTNTATYPVGSGIVWDSDPPAEYAECLLKARILDGRY